jgi:hypothetical protein
LPLPAGCLWRQHHAPDCLRTPILFQKPDGGRQSFDALAYQRWIFLELNFKFSLLSSGVPFHDFFISFVFDLRLPQAGGSAAGLPTIRSSCWRSASRFRIHRIQRPILVKSARLFSNQWDCS